MMTLFIFLRSDNDSRNVHVETTDDGGGSKGTRVMLWKTKRQKFANETGIDKSKFRKMISLVNGIIRIYRILNIINLFDNNHLESKRGKIMVEKIEWILNVQIVERPKVLGSPNSTVEDYDKKITSRG